MKDNDKRIEDALRSLIVDGSFEKITVKEICRRAGVSRKTFYAHYHDKHDVIEHIFRKDIYDSFEYMLRFTWANGLDTMTVVKDFYEKLYAHKDYYTKVVEIRGQNSFQELLLKQTQKLSEDMIEDDFANHTEREYAACYYSAAHAMFLCKWIREGMTIPPSRLCEYYNNILRALSRLNEDAIAR